MKPVFRFSHLDIARCFPTDPTDWWRYEPFVPARGRQGLVASAVLSEGDLSPPMQINSCAAGVLYLCVLHAPLWRVVPPGRLCDVRFLDALRVPRAFECADWVALLDRLVDIFLAHEEQMLRYLLTYETTRGRTHDALLTLLEMYQDFLARYRTPGGRWRPWTPKAGRVSEQAMDKAFKRLEGLTDVMYGDAMSPLPVTFIPFKNLRGLMQRLDNALQRLGPQSRPGHRYVQSARHAAVFHLLDHFGLVDPRTLHKGQRWVSDILRS